MRSVIFFVLLALSLNHVSYGIIQGTTETCSEGVCLIKTEMPHRSFNGTVQVPLYVWYAPWNRYEIFRRQKTLALILPGALVKAEEYDGLARRLARYGFAVAIPEYSSRPISPPLTQTAIDKSIEAGLDCPRNGVRSSAQLVTSVGDFLADRAPRVWMKDAFVIGHNLGGLVASMAVFGQCDDRSDIEVSPMQFDILCEGFRSSDSRINARGVALFQGPLLSPLRVPRNVFLMQIYSPLYTNPLDNNTTPGVRNFRSSVVSGRERSLEVRLDDGTNDYMPIDFVEETNHSSAVCIKFYPLTDPFSTTKKVQDRVVQTCAQLLLISYNGFQLGLSLFKKISGIFEQLPKVVAVRFLK